MGCTKSAVKSSEILSTSNINDYDGGGLGSIPVDDVDGLNEIIVKIDQEITNITNLVNGVSSTSGITYDGPAPSCFSSDSNLNKFLENIANEICNNEKSVSDLNDAISNIAIQVNNNTACCATRGEEIAELDATKAEEADTIAKDGYRNIDGWFSPRDTDFSFTGLTSTLGDGSGGNFKGIDSAGQWVDLPEETVNLVATRDNYVDVDKDAFYVTDVAIGSPAPARATASASRILKAETDASSVVSSTDLRETSYIREDDISTGAVTADKMATGAITSASLEDVVTAGTLGSTDILEVNYDAKGRITSVTDLLQVSSPTDSQALVYDSGLGKWINKSLDLSSEILSTEVTVTSAEILTSNTSPVTLIPAPSAGFFLDIVSISARVIYGTTPYATSTTTLIGMNGVSDAAFVTTKLLPATGNNFPRLNPQSLVNNTHYKEQSPLIMTSNGADPTAGDSDFKFYISYRVVPI